MQMAKREIQQLQNVHNVWVVNPVKFSKDVGLRLFSQGNDYGIVINCVKTPDEANQ